MDYEFMQAFEAYTGINLQDTDGVTEADIQITENMSAMESDFEIAMEGVNIDAMKDFTEARKQIKEHKKAINEAINRNDYKTAATEAEAVASVANSLADKLKNIPYSISSALLANAALGVVFALVGGLVGLVKAKANMHDSIIKHQVSNVSSQIKVGYKYSTKNGSLSGEDALKQLRKDADKTQIIKSTGTALGIGGIAAFMDAIKLNLKAAAGDADYTDNDRNVLLATFRAVLKNTAKQYSEQAAKYRGMKPASANECWLF